MFAPARVGIGRRAEVEKERFGLVVPVLKRRKRPELVGFARAPQRASRKQALPAGRPSYAGLSSFRLYPKRTSVR